MLYIGDVVPLKKNRLKEFREKRELSQEQLAAKLGVTRQTIISIEGGKYVPSLELSLKMAAEFKCKVEDLFGI
ncbi:MAG: helix-turn-helix transcriptional regulator [archaeon]|jgi:putative transcriptional regulator